MIFIDLLFQTQFYRKVCTLPLGQSVPTGKIPCMAICDCISSLGIVPNSGRVYNNIIVFTQ